METRISILSFDVEEVLKKNVEEEEEKTEKRNSDQNAKRF